MSASNKPNPTWNDVKSKLTEFDRSGLLGLIQDLYAASKENEAFLHARFALGGDVLKPYKAVVDRWLWLDVFKNQVASVARAKKAISDYKKAIGQPEGLAELMIFYCECAAGFSDDVGLQDEGHFDALVTGSSRPRMASTTSIRETLQDGAGRSDTRQPGRPVHLTTWRWCLARCLLPSICRLMQAFKTCFGTSPMTRREPRPLPPRSARPSNVVVRFLC